ncbi:PDZ domain-containing protein 9-like isoform X2 [Mixophyes fleayi]|uniref:PDZ domain-containing protein 9-like isoform X2 n=1 Tax=Mixophyes fleayi TaxID=3061075 RepID=UPI003F4DDBF4
MIFKGNHRAAYERPQITTVKANLQMEKTGLGMSIIQNGAFLQILNILKDGVVAKNGQLLAGDVLFKIGYDDVLGCSLREVKQILNVVPIGSHLQVLVYRGLIDIPSDWDNMGNSSKENTAGCVNSATDNIYSSSDEEEEDQSHVRVLSVGVDIGHDIMLHNEE